MYVNSWKCILKRQKWQRHNAAFIYLALIDDDKTWFQSPSPSVKTYRFSRSPAAESDGTSCTLSRTRKKLLFMLNFGDVNSIHFIIMSVLYILE